MSSEDDLEKIRHHGWRQGSILPVEMCARIGETTNSTLQDGDAILVISQSCNLVHGDFELEPHVELLIARPIDALDGAFMNGRSPRRLQLCIEVDGAERSYEIQARNRLVAPRGLLAECMPDSSRSVASPTLRTLIAWISARYDRVALPDAFQGRLRPVQSKLRSAMKKLTDASELFIALNAWDDLPPDRDYQIELVIVMPRDRYSEPEIRASTQRVAEEIAKQLRSCDGMSLGDAPSLVPDDEFTLADAKIMSRWGDFDYVSLADQDGHVA